MADEVMTEGEWLPAETPAPSTGSDPKGLR